MMVVVYLKKSEGQGVFPIPRLEVLLIGPKVCDGGLEGTQGFLEVPKPAVAHRTEQTSHAARHMVVVDDEGIVLESGVPDIFGSDPADGTAVVLLQFQSIYFANCDAVPLGGSRRGAARITFSPVPPTFAPKGEVTLWLICAAYAAKHY